MKIIPPISTSGATPISTSGATTFHLKSLNIKKIMT
jgi:hypothetical protein